MTHESSHVIIHKALSTPVTANGKWTVAHLCGAVALVAFSLGAWIF